LIRHALWSQSEPFPVKPLTVAVIQPSLRTVLVPAIGLTSLLSPCFLSAVLTAVTLSSVTGSAYIEDAPAAAHFFAENDFGGHPIALELDSGRPSCQAGGVSFSSWWRFTAATACTSGRCCGRGVSLIGQRFTLHHPSLQRASLRG